MFLSGKENERSIGSRCLSIVPGRAIIVSAAVLVCMLYNPSVLLALDPNKALTQYIHDEWRAERGLPQDAVQTILQTNDGYIWLGTQEGLARFDGVRFTVFDMSKVKELRDNYILSLYEDGEGGLWIGTRGGGLTHMLNGKFSTDTTEEGLASNFIQAIYEDRQGNLWIGTSLGLSLLKDGEFISYKTKDGLSSDNVMSICEDRKDNLWIGTLGGGLNCMRDGRFIAYSIKEGLSSDIVRVVLIDRKDNLWIGTDNGLNRLKDGKIAIYTIRDGLSSNVIYSIHEDREGSLWIGTQGGGLNRLRDETITSFTMMEGLSNNVILSIFEDHEGSLWIGTFGGGLNRLRDGRISTISTKEGLSADLVWTIYEDCEGAIWMGTQGGGLNKYKNNEFTYYTTEEGLANNIIRPILMDRSGNLWIGTDHGLSRFKNGKFTTYTTRDGLSSNSLYSICESNDGSLWIGTRKGLNRLKDGKFTVYTTKDGLTNDIIKVILTDREGNLWAGTNNGLNCFKNGEFITYTTKDGLSNNFIYSLYEDDKGVLWIGSRCGLNRLMDGKITSYTVEDGMYNDVVFRILEDGNENLWMSCNKGISKVSKRELNDYANGKIDHITSVSFGTNDGMKSRECNGGSQPAGCKTRDGRLWFPTNKGVTVIDPMENTKTNYKSPPVIIEKAFVDGEEISMKTEQKTVFPSGTEKFEFHYTGLSYLVPDKVRFKFRLEGYDKTWVDAGTRRVAYYTNIPPGNYIFRVIACNNNGIWNEEGASFEFYLKHYFYQTSFFYICCGLCIVGASLGGFRIRVRRMKSRERRLTRLVEERTGELSNVMHQLEQTNQKLERANRELERLSLTDRLTNLANRSHFEAVLELEWRRSVREQHYMSLIMLDIDFFKPYNDTYGHLAGDECLREVAKVIKNSACRAGDLAARYGGEEFVVILSSTDSRGATVVAERMRKGLEELRIPHARSIIGNYVTLSAGTATTIPVMDSSPDMLISAADQALYKAKEKGRNSVISMALLEESPSPS